MALAYWPAPDRLVPEELFMNRLVPERKGIKAPSEWKEWLKTLFPAFYSKPLGQRHREYWRWVLSVKQGERPRPFIGIWDRGGGKSVSAEGGAVALGVRGKRHYGLYVSGTQVQADKHVASVATMLESPTIDTYYPKHARPKLGRHGNQRAWRRNRLWTAGDFAIDALGLDVAARGIRLDEWRPDFIVLDDIDGLHDSLATTMKKKETITSTILPAGSPDLAVLAIQNMISRNGIFAQLAEGTAGFLVDRILSGPFPSIEGLKWEWRRHPESGIKRPFITAGKATWEGKPLEVCQHEMDTYGIASFMKECQHDVKSGQLGVVLRFKPANLIDLTDDECRELCKARTAFGGLDFQAARFAFTLRVTDKHRRAIRIDEYFSQFEGLKVRAFNIHAMCKYYGIDWMMPIWGDAANPQDIMEMNAHFRDGWDVCAMCGALWPGREAQRCGSCNHGKHVHETSKLRVAPGGKETKMRRVAVERMNDALDRGTLLYRTGIEYDWMLGRTSTDEGTPMRGSRMMWELENWSYPKMKPGEAQDEDPDDNTADGADMMAADRYACMSHWKGHKLPKEYGTHSDDQAFKFDYKKREFTEPKHAADDLMKGNTGRRTPRVKVPRFRGRG